MSRGRTARIPEGELLGSRLHLLELVAEPRHNRQSTPLTAAIRGSTAANAVRADPPTYRPQGRRFPRALQAHVHRLSRPFRRNRGGDTPVTRAKPAPNLPVQALLTVRPNGHTVARHRTPPPWGHHGRHLFSPPAEMPGAGSAHHSPSLGR